MAIGTDQKEFKDLPADFYRYKNTDADIKINPVLAGIEYEVNERKKDGKIILTVYAKGKKTLMEIDAEDLGQLEIINK